MVVAESTACEVSLGKLHRAILPIACLMIGFCYLDRSNIAYMQLQLQFPSPAGLGFSHTLYGNASGLFFVGYAAFQIPSNLILVCSHTGLYASYRLLAAQASVESEIDILHVHGQFCCQDCCHPGQCKMKPDKRKLIDLVVCNMIAYH
jgi:hypothetical protein